MISRVGVGMIGFGTVGTGVARILLDNAALIRRRVGVPIELVRIADLDVTRDRGITLPPGMLVNDAKQVLADPNVDIVVELIGGYDFAKRIILEAIAAGKAVVTANKALLALHGEEIFAAAARRGVDIGFEASVGGGIPVIHALKEGLAANAIQSIYGIINGTSNYILSRMTNEGKGFEETLGEAQRAGYAEADPTFDVAGTDSAHKLAILANLAFGTPINFKDLYTEGVTHITEHDITYAREFGYQIKLLGIAKLVEGEVEARVHPTMLPADSPLAKIEGVYNAIQLVGDAVGDVVLVGRGAGDLAAGSAVVSDIIAGARNLLKGGAGGLRLHLSRRHGARSACAPWKRFGPSTTCGLWSPIAPASCRRLRANWAAAASASHRCCRRGGARDRPFRSSSRRIWPGSATCKPRSGKSTAWRSCPSRRR